jgi:hypothetical protein
VSSFKLHEQLSEKKQRENDKSTDISYAVMISSRVDRFGMGCEGKILYVKNK